MRVAAVVCTKDRPRDLRRLLESLERQHHAPAEVVVVDASRGPETRAVVSGRHLPGDGALTYVSSASGLPRQRNAGVAALTSGPDIVCFFDDDVELADDYLYAVVTGFRADRAGHLVGVCGNTTNELKRPFLSRLVRRCFFITDNASGRLLPSGDAGHVFAPTHDQPVDVLSGCNMCFRGDVFRLHGLRFDEALADYAYMEDQDFSVRARQYGDLVQLAEAELTHHASGVGRPSQRQLFETYAVNSFYLLRKNLRPGPLNYAAYGWRLVGKLLHALSVALALRSLDPVVGWFQGVAHLTRLERRPQRPHG
jgi:GT2 family glycosyltransferase